LPKFRYSGWLLNWSGRGVAQRSYSTPSRPTNFDDV
jgi:hypothetical protein